MNMHVNRCCNSWRQKCDQERSWKDIKIEGPRIRNSAHVEYETKRGIGNKRGDWNHLKITPTIPEQNTGKARN